MSSVRHLPGYRPRLSWCYELAEKSFDVDLAPHLIVGNYSIASLFPIVDDDCIFATPARRILKAHS